ncbi:MAG TPA: flavin reductase family protein [Pirellulales bacterium]|nr:flavin reductase family protein [Pirellulales bacterium]
MILDVATARPLDVYRLLTDVVTPRPIAWVTSIDAQGRVNLAPFSFFNAFGANPPAVVFSPTLRRDGSKKDTLLNVEATGEFVLNAAVASLANQVNLTSSELPYGESEAELAQLTLVPAVKVKPPRVAESSVHLECRLRQVVPVGDGPMSANLVIGEVILMHVEDRLLGPDGRVDPRKLQTIARLGADWYCRTTDLFEMPRPV